MVTPMMIRKIGIVTLGLALSLPSSAGLAGTAAAGLRSVAAEEAAAGGGAATAVCASGFAAVFAGSAWTATVQVSSRPRVMSSFSRIHLLL